MIPDLLRSLLLKTEFIAASVGAVLGLIAGLCARELFRKYKRRKLDRALELDKVIINDAVTVLERGFEFQQLLALDYFKHHRDEYYDRVNTGWQLPRRNYYNLLNFLQEIHEYRPDDSRRFAKRLRNEAADPANSDAIFAEIIVYRYYVRLVSEGIIRSVRHGGEDCDLIVDRLNDTTAYLEVFSIKPKAREMQDSAQFVANELRTHLQDPEASIRQKLLRKVRKQKQMTVPRDNYAVIELNASSIAGGFAVLSSLSGGYKVTFDVTTMKTVASGYDWTNSVFEDSALRHLKAVIFFSLGDYESRRFIFNPRFQDASKSS